MLGHDNSMQFMTQYHSPSNAFKKIFIKIHDIPIGIFLAASRSPCIQIKCGSPRHLKGHGGDDNGLAKMIKILVWVN